MTGLTSIAPSYHRARARFGDLATSLRDDELAKTVPACPEWSVFDVVRHCVGMPLALGAGRFPTGDIDGWIQEIVNSHRGASVSELLASWDEPFPALDEMLDHGGYLLFIDLVTHEHDVRHAVGKPGGRDDPEVAECIPLMLRDLGSIAQHRGLGAIEVRVGDRSWTSHAVKPEWSIVVTAFEAIRVLESRRTAAEIRSTPGTGDCEPFIDVIDAHLPLPRSSLGERGA